LKPRRTSSSPRGSGLRIRARALHGVVAAGHVLLKASVTARLSFFLLASGDQAARSAYGVSCRGVRS
jgi:hypothetical protein